MKSTPSAFVDTNVLEHLAFRRILAWLRGLRKKDQADPPDEEEPEMSYGEFLREIAEKDQPAAAADAVS